MEDIVFNGDLTEVFTLYGGVPITYVLRENSGELRIDDVQFPMPDKPNSVKELMEIVIPAYQFAQIAAKSQPPEDLQTPSSAKELDQLGSHYFQIIKQMQSICSFDFNHTVWKDTEIVPDTFFSCREHLETPSPLFVKSMRINR
ncbi:MAG: hypothetical protein R3C11_21215 [Planctomycetaceae bacterium]